jgi:hypothetical protein
MIRIVDPESIAQVRSLSLSPGRSAEGRRRQSGESMRQAVFETGSRRALIVTVVCVLSAICSTALAGDVRGTLTIPTDLPSMSPPVTDAAAGRARYWEEWNGFLDPRPDRIDAAREMAVVLTGEGPVSEGEQPRLRLHNGALLPATVVVRVSTGFQIQNDDGCSYEIFAEGLEELSPVQTAPGMARPITVSTAGHWPLADRIYPHVRGHLHAIPDLVSRAQVEPNGSYVFHGVAPGSYTLHVYHGDHEVTSTPVAVGDAHELVVPAIQVQAAAAAATPEETH